MRGIIYFFLWVILSAVGKNVFAHEFEKILLKKLTSSPEFGRFNSNAIDNGGKYFLIKYNDSLFKHVDSSFNEIEKIRNNEIFPESIIYEIDSSILHYKVKVTNVIRNRVQYYFFKKKADIEKIELSFCDIELLNHEKDNKNEWIDSSEIQELQDFFRYLEETNDQVLIPLKVGNSKICKSYLISLDSIKDFSLKNSFRVHEGKKKNQLLIKIINEEIIDDTLFQKFLTSQGSFINLNCDDCHDLLNKERTLPLSVNMDCLNRSSEEMKFCLVQYLFGLRVPIIKENQQSKNYLIPSLFHDHFFRLVQMRNLPSSPR